MGGIPGGESRSLQHTPSWALATVCFLIISISILFDHFIHLLSNWLKRHGHISLFEAVQKLKSGVMVLGFMSLSLTVIQTPVSRICIPKKMAYTLLPCPKTKPVIFSQELPAETRFTAIHGFGHCQSQGKESLISEEGMNQLSILIFVLAVMQIVYSVLTMALGRAKMRRWKPWETETRTIEYQVANDPNRFRLAKETTFGRRHTSSWTSTSPQLWIKCFFRQFFNSVAKVDYLTLRHGFISAHLPPNTTFNFQKYIQRSLEDDFKVVASIRPFMWILMVIFMFLSVHGWHVYLGISFLPLVIVLVVNTKMLVIVEEMAIQLKGQNGTIKGTPLVRPNDAFFWFGHPELVLNLLHLSLFLNAFEVAFLTWVTLEFGRKSCYHEHIELIILRIVLACPALMQLHHSSSICSCNSDGFRLEEWSTSGRESRECVKEMACRCKKEEAKAATNHYALTLRLLLMII